MKPFIVATSLIALGLTIPARADIIITEVHPNGSSASYNADWFELTNTGATPVNISGWTIDDNSNASSSAVALRGITSITAGQSVVFAEGNAAGSTDAAIQTNFISAWFNGNAPVGFAMGFYGGSGVGLSSGGDAVNIFDATGTRVAGVAFGAASPTTSTFDNAAGISGMSLPLPVLTTVSVAGVNGAFLSSPGGETGSPGRISGAAAVPEPASMSLLGVAGAALLLRRRRAR
ncbi:MAG TPA: lamin tail domain-containing protein [Phycisphaerae bacterium]|nr:lamin tail domain-containing protein [Phycisphaerae bacterium]